MSTLAVSDVRSALERKGFVSDTSGAHINFHYKHNGKFTGIRTWVSHGSKKDLGDHLVKSMAHQTKLTRSEFENLIECSLSQEGYHKLMIDRGLIDPDPKVETTKDDQSPSVRPPATRT